MAYGVRLPTRVSFCGRTFLALRLNAWSAWSTSLSKYITWSGDTVNRSVIQTSRDIPPILCLFKQVATMHVARGRIAAITLRVKIKIADTRLPSVGLRSWSRLLAVSLQETWVINPAVACHYFPPGPQLPSQPLWGLLPTSLLGEQRPLTSMVDNIDRSQC